MKRSNRLAWLLFFSFLALIGASVSVAIYALSRIASEPVEENSLLEVTLSGPLSDGTSEDPALRFLGNRTFTLHTLERALRMASVDKRIRGVLLRVGNLQAGWATAQELRQALKDFRASGKTITAFLETGDNLDYFVAVAADKVYLAPQGTLFLNGLSLDAEFYKDTLEKVGVHADMHRIGEYKGAIESYTRDAMSDEMREVLNSLLEEQFSSLVQAIAEGRNLTSDEVRSAIDAFSFSPAKAVEARLLDGLLYYDQVLEGLRNGSEEEPHRIEVGAYAGTDPQSLDLEKGPKVAVLYVTGEIQSGESGGGGLFGGSSVGSDTIVDAVRSIRDDEEIKAAVLRISSPGGSATAADIMWRELALLKEKKPLVVSMADLAASGGYWIATAGSPIVAQPGTLTGSIGVFMGKFNVSGLMDKIGMRVETVSRGQYAEIMSPYRDFSEAELPAVEAMLQETYDTFLNRVSSARNMPPAEVDKVARGRVWAGRDAQQKGLVDELGGLDRAVALACEQAGLGPQADPELVEFPQRERSFGALVRDLLRSQVSVEGELKEALRLANERGVIRDPGPRAQLPFRLIIR